MSSPSPAAISMVMAPPPIVYSIAGSDSGGGAGIQADLHAMHAMGCHGCSAITCLTAQNSRGVSAVHAPPTSFLKQQLATLLEDMPPRAIKIGMLGTRALAETVGEFLQNVTTSSTSTSDGGDSKPWVVVDPVMISTSGHALIDDDCKQAMISCVFPYADVLTPNKYEAEALLNRKLTTPQEVEEGARELLALGAKSVLIKGGHSLSETSGPSRSVASQDVNATLGYAQDFFLSSLPSPDEPRLCDGGVWLRTDRYDTPHTHGTGCTLSSAIASALALSSSGPSEGATRAIQPMDACCLAKAYVTAGIGRGVGLGKGPGPVAHTAFPSSHFPSIAIEPTVKTSAIPQFRRMKAWSDDDDDDDESVVRLGRILPIVDTVEWVETLTQTAGITDIQLRVKDETDPAKILDRVERCQALCGRAGGVRLWINDHWEAAIAAGCFGVHLGQEDLRKCHRAGGIRRLLAANLALGVSTHSYGELAAALAARPSYVSLGPIFATASKQVAFQPQGLEICRKWRQLLPARMPLVAIGGIGDAETARLVQQAGTDCAAVIGAITNAANVQEAVDGLNQAMSRSG